MKTKQEYLEMVPPHLQRNRWIREVEGVFEKLSIGFWSEEDAEDYLKFFFTLKPRSLRERWATENENYKKT